MEKTKKILFSPSEMKSLAVKFGVGILILFAIVFFLGMHFKEPIMDFSKYFVNSFGLYGIFWGVFLVDVTLFFLTNEPLLLIGINGGLGIYPVFITGCIASILAGCAGYCMGMMVQKIPLCKNFLEKLDPNIQEWLQKYGVWVVVVGALTPVPFAYTTWMAGALRLRFFPFFLACLFRIPKIAFYFWLVVKGWNMGIGL